MPIISMFYGIIIKMYFDDHYPPHFHAVYQDTEAVFSLDGNEIRGKLPRPQTNMVKAWCAIHHDELVANWKIASHQEAGQVYKIEPLK